MAILDKTRHYIVLSVLVVDVPNAFEFDVCVEQASSAVGLELAFSSELTGKIAFGRVL